MAKFCNNGHQMEESWEICPYCQRAGFKAHQGAVNDQKTRLEFAPAVEAKSALPVAPVVARKTVVLSEVRTKGALAGWLVALDGDQKGEDFRLQEGQNTIGSASDADVVIRDQTISGKHASLRYKEGKFFLTDLDSLNGTFLNSTEESIARSELKDNDLIRLGAVTLKFKTF